MVLFVFSKGRNEISTSSLITFWFCHCTFGSEEYKNINNFTYPHALSRCIAGINAVIVIPLTIPKLKLSCLIIILTPPWHGSPCHTNLCIAVQTEQEGMPEGHFVYWKITSSQSLILLKIAPAARTYGLHLCSEELFIFFRLFFKVPIQGDVFHFPKNAFKHY